MTDRPILFSGPMVRALLAGRKTQTRRVAAPATPGMHLDRVGPTGWQFTGDGGLPRIPYTPRYADGDRLYVREAWRTVGDAGMRDQVPPRDLSPCATWFEADGEAPRDVFAGKFRQGMHMPRWASRLTLIVTGVRVQRLQEISEADAADEGVCETNFYDQAEHKVSAGAPWSVARLAFADLWNSLNADRGYGWDANPWVAAYSFIVHAGNIDQIGGAA